MPAAQALYANWCSTTLTCRTGGSPLLDNQRLGELTHRALITWLDHRRDRWPHTPNRHVLLTTKTALRTTPVSQTSVKQSLSDNGFTIERIRADRILHEALTAGPDPLHLSLSFSASPTTPRGATPPRGSIRNSV